MPPPTISNEDLAIVTVIPMPVGQVHFANLKGILQEFFDIERTRVSSITKCPFGQAYVRFESVTDRDSYINRSPLPFEDVQLVFQKHNEGLNWRSYNMNREAWILIVGFPSDLRNSHEINHATSSFGKFLVWDKVKTTDAAIVIKVRVVALEDIPSSVVVSGANNPMGESWTCPIV